MAPTRKSRSVNKRISSSNDVSPEKDGVNSVKSKQRKKKLTDKLGSQWSKEELERFYEAYRMYGKDWKKVAGVVRNRTFEMVEALYNMNRAYLSLPEGTASVVGLIAMMTDHYNVLEESDSERESNDALGSRKFVKRKREKVQLSVSKDQSHSIASSDGCLSLLKKRRLDGIVPHAVGKRTPRIPVSYSYKKDYTENYASPYRRSLKATTDANDDEVAHVVALALTEAAQRGGSPQVSQSPCRRVEQKPSPVQRWERKQVSEASRAKFHDLSMDEELLDGSIESRGADNGEYARDNSSLMDMEGIGTVEVLQKGGKFYRKRERVKNVGNHQLDDGGEACSGTEEGLSFSSLKEKVDVEVTNDKLEKSSPKGGRKRNKKLFFGDETPGLNALQTLADLSLMMPISTIDSESSIQLKGNRISADKDGKSALPEAASTSHKRHKLKHSLVPEVEVSTSKKSKLGKESTKDTNVLSESKEQLPFAYASWKRKRKSMVSKVANAKLDSFPIGPLKDEVTSIVACQRPVGPETMWVKSQSNRDIWTVILLNKKSCTLINKYNFWSSAKLSSTQTTPPAQSPPQTTVPTIASAPKIDYKSFPHNPQPKQPTVWPLLSTFTSSIQTYPLDGLPYRLARHQYATFTTHSPPSSFEPSSYAFQPSEDYLNLPSNSIVALPPPIWERPVYDNVQRLLDRLQPHLAVLRTIREDNANTQTLKVWPQQAKVIPLSPNTPGFQVPWKDIVDGICNIYAQQFVKSQARAAPPSLHISKNTTFKIYLDIMCSRMPIVDKRKTKDVVSPRPSK